VVFKCWLIPIQGRVIQGADFGFCTSVERGLQGCVLLIDAIPGDVMLGSKLAAFSSSNAYSIEWKLALGLRPA